MTLEEAGRILRDMYNNAPWGERTTHIRLFGIKYADELEVLSDKGTVREAGLPDSYSSEVYKGRKLARYVRVL